MMKRSMPQLLDRMITLVTACRSSVDGLDETVNVAVIRTCKTVMPGNVIGSSGERSLGRLDRPRSCRFPAAKKG